MESDFKLISSPLQSFTDYRFRNPFYNHFGGVDIYYAPYIRLNGKLEIKPVYERDLLNRNIARGMKVVPQIMTNSAEEFLYVSKYVKSLGYDELNWNLGCPYPMVTKKGMGSGLICEPAKIDEILKQVHNELDIIVSMKMRMGYDSPNEILDVFPILEKYPIKNIGIHARIGRQLYKGGVDLEAFERCVQNSPHELWYNGDITSVGVFRELQDRFPSINHWMIGRGLIADPFLPQMIKRNATNYPNSKMKVFETFHNDLFDNFLHSLANDRQAIQKMYSYWEYFGALFEDAKRTMKKIKKAKTIEEYTAGVNELFNSST